MTFGMRIPRDVVVKCGSQKIKVHPSLCAPYESLQLQFSREIGQEISIIMKCAHSKKHALWAHFLINFAGKWKGN